MSFGTALTIVFIVLKLCGVITWSWLWVLSPLWITILLAIAYVIMFNEWFNKVRRCKYALEVGTTKKMGTHQRRNKSIRW